MKITDRFRQLITKETRHENESNKMTVLLRILSLVLLLFFVIMSLGFFVTGGYSASAGNLLLAALFALIFFASYILRKSPLIWCFIAVTALWAVSMLWLFGPDSGFQLLPPFVILIFFFASYDSLSRKVIFGFCCFIVYQGLSMIYGNRAPALSLSPAAHNCVRDCNMFIIILCTCIAAHAFSKDSLNLENKLIEYNKRLKAKANTDPLTGLNNRSMAIDYLQDFVKKTDEMLASICICDIDHFKNVNDTYGHDVGDLVLKAVADAIRKTIGDDGFVARWGGEEFFIAFPGSNGDVAKDLLYMVQSAIRKVSVESSGQVISVTLTYGLTEYDNNKTLTENLKDADNNLYAGKQKGRNTIVF
ncbi:MAG: GGDEF domain-containing protein [Lachnospiraceae bacterium]|nr:GGDEF domain-containing protein [Lachnospiraceae bacterium]